MNTKEIEVTLIDSLTDSGVDCKVETFHDAGLLTRDNGLVLTLTDGSEFQITIVKSK